MTEGNFVKVVVQPSPCYRQDVVSQEGLLLFIRLAPSVKSACVTNSFLYGNIV